MPDREPLGQQAAAVFGPSEDLGAVALNDEADLHENLETSVRSAVSTRAAENWVTRARCPAITPARNVSSYITCPTSSAASS
jgi:hypothetical protein